jgi:hypothetical protein
MVRTGRVEMVRGSGAPRTASPKGAVAGLDEADASGMSV